MYFVSIAVFWRLLLSCLLLFFRAGPCGALVAAPSVDTGVVAAQQDIGNAQAAVHAWSREVGVIEAAAVRRGVGVLDRGSIVAEDTGDEARRGFDHDEGAEFTAREDVVADGEAFKVEQLERAVVEAFVSAAE